MANRSFILEYHPFGNRRQLKRVTQCSRSKPYPVSSTKQDSKEWAEYSANNGHTTVGKWNAEKAFRHAPL